MYDVTPHGYRITNTFLLTDTPQAGVVNLALTKGSSMRYTTSPVQIVDFPGEYDIEGHTIICYDAGGYLHYQILRDEGMITIIQDTALLEKESLGEVALWLCVNEKTKDAIERDELEGDIIVMEGFTYPVSE